MIRYINARISDLDRANRFNKTYFSIRRLLSLYNVSRKSLGITYNGLVIRYS